MILMLEKSGKLGVENINKVFTILLTLYVRLKKIIAKPSVSGALELATLLLMYQNDLDAFKMAWQEVQDLKPEEGEVTQINEHLQKEAKRLDINNANLFGVISEVLDFVSEVYQLWNNVVDAYKKAVLLYGKIVELRRDEDEEIEVNIAA